MTDDKLKLSARWTPDSFEAQSMPDPVPPLLEANPDGFFSLTLELDNPLEQVCVDLSREELHQLMRDAASLLGFRSIG
jgi:hypothetical protein